MAKPSYQFVRRILQKDNSTAKEKIALRRKALREVAQPVVLETHGGAGKLYRALYAHITSGVVFEKDDRKVRLLAGQRPTWAVYKADCIAALADGAADWLPATLIDIDPYGDPWPVIHAFFTSERERPKKIAVVVNDGLRQKVKMNGAWSTRSLYHAVERFGNNMHDQYLNVCAWLMQTEATQAGYAVSRFEGYYCGHAKQMTHYLAVLDKR